MVPTRGAHWLVLAMLAACNRQPVDDTAQDTPDPPTDDDGDGFFSDVDCDDDSADIYPGATEYCDGRDEDCDGVVDGGVRILWYRDVDGDGFGDPGERAEACQPPAGFVASPLDCDDSDPAVSPAAAEIPYNGVDDDCDPNTVDDDLDRDGAPIATDCDDADPLVHPTRDEEPYNGVDDDCDPASPDDDVDGDGFLLDEECDDDDDAVFPGALERLGDEVDQDCDGGVDTTPWIDLGIETTAMEGPLWAADQFGVALVGLMSRDGSEQVHLPAMIWDWSEGGLEPRRSPVWVDGPAFWPGHHYDGADLLAPEVAFGLHVASGRAATVNVAWERSAEHNASHRLPMFGRSGRSEDPGLVWRFASALAGVDPERFGLPPADGATVLSGTGGARVWCSEQSTQLVAFTGPDVVTPILAPTYLNTAIGVSNRAGAQFCWPMEDEELGWVAVRATEGRFYRSVPVLGSLYDTLDTVDELSWPPLHLVGKRVERSHLALVTSAGELHVSRSGSVPVRRLGPMDTRGRNDWSVTRAATSGEGSFTYVIAVVEDTDFDTLPEIVFAYGPATGRLIDLRLPEARPDGLDWAEEVSVIDWEGEVWVSATWQDVMTGTRRVTWLKYRAPAP